MKDSLAHLPQQKQDELKLIAEKICQRIETGLIILFGSYARGDWVDGPHQQGHGRLTIDKKSDYDILVITHHKATAENTTAIQALQKEILGMGLSTHTRLIVHDLKFVNEQLRLGQYFFTDIRKEGIALYNDKSLSFPGKIRTHLTAEERKQLIQGYFDQSLTVATQAYDAYKIFLDKRWYKKAAFELHQAVEHTYKAVLLVFTNYSPKEHYLNVLGEQAAHNLPELEGVFPADTDEQKELFELLDYAYIGARYDPNFTITKAQLEQLAVYVRNLLEIVERTCREYIEGLS